MNDDLNVKPIFIDRVTTVPAVWANTVSTLVYDIFGKSTTAEQAREALGIGTLALQEADAVNILGGDVNGVDIGFGVPGAAKFTHAFLTDTPTHSRHAVPKAYLDQRLGNLPDVIAGLGEYAKKASPTFTGIPLAPTAAVTVRTTQLATCEFVGLVYNTLIGNAPTALNSIEKLAAAINNSASFGTSVNTALGLRLRMDTGSQGLSAQQKTNARNNLALARVSWTGNYSDLIGAPTSLTADWSTVANKPNFAVVATSGRYSDLLGIPAGVAADWSTITNKPALPLLAAANTFAKSQSVVPKTINAAAGQVLIVLTDSNVFKINLAGSTILTNPVLTGLDGQTFKIYLKQDATGSRAITCGNKFIFPTGVTFNYASAPGSITVISGIVDETDDELICQVVTYGTVYTPPA